jgi:phosphatidate phosphatase APP1
MASYIPILLSFYALSNGKEVLIFGQITNTPLNDLSFVDYGRRRTFRTLFSLYRTKPVIEQAITFRFDSVSIRATTDAHGSFFLKHKSEDMNSILQDVTLASGEEVLIMNGLYLRSIHYLINPFIVISDIDDTLLHSHITNKIRQLRTLMFTPVERRKAVVPMQEVISNLVTSGATPVYLSNSEQNLYPLIYRFLMHNGFPAGPLFLRRLRRFWDLLRYRRLPEEEINKVKILDAILPMFKDKKFALVGDNTQHDLPIYLAAAEKFPDLIKYILIRRVVRRSSLDALAREAAEKLAEKKIELRYSDDFPSSFPW